MATARVSESSGHSSSSVISTSETSGQPIITDSTSELNHLALIVVCGYVN